MSAEQSPVLLDRADGVATLTLNRPEARNAMTPQMYAGLDAICAEIGTDPELRCVVLRGAGGKSFVSGSDIAQFLDFETAEDGVDYERRMAGHLDNIAGIAVPTVAVGAASASASPSSEHAPSAPMTRSAARAGRSERSTGME